MFIAADSNGLLHLREHNIGECSCYFVNILVQEHIVLVLILWQRNTEFSYAIYLNKQQNTVISQKVILICNKYSVLFEQFDSTVL